MTAHDADPADARAVDLPSLCRHGRTLAGRWPLASMERLASGLFEAPATDDAVDWRASGSLVTVPGGDAQLWLALDARVAVRLQCQRCLQPMTEVLVVDRRLRFVRDEDEAARLDEDSEDDVLALPARLDLQALVEDELILALPLVPRHEHCDAPRPPDDHGNGGGADTHRPFAGLAALRRRPS